MVKYYTKAKIIQPVSTRMVIKKIIVYKKKKTSEQITHSFLLRTSKVEKVIIVYQ
jgi:hypothetical protein